MNLPFDFFSVLAAVGTSLFSGFLAWVVSDARSKSRLEFMTEKVNTLKLEHDKAIKAHSDKIGAMEIKTATGEQAHVEIHRMIERIDSQKASKEVVDGFRSEISNLRVDMDKRFDKIERLLERVANPQK